MIQNTKGMHPHWHRIHIEKERVQYQSLCQWRIGERYTGSVCHRCTNVRHICTKQNGRQSWVPAVYILQYTQKHKLCSCTYPQSAYIWHPNWHESNATLKNTTTKENERLKNHTINRSISATSVNQRKWYPITKCECMCTKVSKCTVRICSLPPWLICRNRACGELHRLRLKIATEVPARIMAVVGFNFGEIMYIYPHIGPERKQRREKGYK